MAASNTPPLPMYPAIRAASPERACARASVTPHKAAAPAKPYEIYDSVTPSQIPSGHEVAT